MNGFKAKYITPLVADSRVSGRTVIYQFRCPVTNKGVAARYTVPAAGYSAGNMVTNALGRSAIYEVQRQVHGLIRSVFGYSILGRVAGQMASTAMYQAQSQSRRQPTNRGLSASDVQNAMMPAFQSVSGQFAFDTKKDRWVHQSALMSTLSLLDAQLAKAPVNTSYDQVLLARMMVEIARADGDLSADEHGYLQEVIPQELGSVSDFVHRPPLTRAELQEASPGAVRLSLFALVTIVALVDERLDAGEAQKLQILAAGLGLDGRAQQQARAMAQTWVVDQALERMIGWGGHDAHARKELVAIGERIGMPREQVEIAEARFLKRRA